MNGIKRMTVLDVMGMVILTPLPMVHFQVFQRMMHVVIANSKDCVDRAIVRSLFVVLGEDFAVQFLYTNESQSEKQELGKQAYGIDRRCQRV